jgi:V8-like Glu-specific endopeptidase
MKNILKPLFVTAALFAVLATTQVANAAGNSDNVPNANAKGYWDEEKINNAKPIELIVDEKTKTGRIEATAKRNSGSTTSSNSGASWNNAGLPLTATGKVFFSVGASNFVCSGALVNDGLVDRAIVLTAGHCVYDAGKGYVTNWMFIPNFDSSPKSSCATTPNRCWYASNLVARAEFVNAGGFNGLAIQHDWAFAVIYPGGSKSNGTTLPDTTPAAPNSFNLDVTGFSAANQTSYAFGYPAAFPYSGNDLVYAFGPILVDNNYSTWGMSSKMTGGASGGPWFSNFNTTTKTGNLSSLNSYKYDRDTTRMYGPQFGPKTQATFDAAKAATGLANITVG